MTLAQQTGQTAEDAVCRYLQQTGLKLVTRNYSCKLGEIDLIMKDGDSIVFVEVRFRRTNHYGDGLDSVTVSKQNKLLRTGSFYLQRHNLTEKMPCRFDVVAVSRQAGQFSFDWIKNALQIW
jgi:putative endonuclease